VGRTFPTDRRLAWFLAAAVVLVAVLGAGGVWTLDRAVAAEPTETTSVLRVRTGGDREAGGTVSPLPGVTLAAYTNPANSSPADPDDATVEVARCVADAQGLCDIVFSGTAGPDGENYGKRFWVKQVNVLPDYDPNYVLRTGATGATPAYVTPYSFRTPALVAGRLYTSGSGEFMDSSGVNANNRLASTGTWQSSRLNPALAPQCGLDVALIADWSSSVQRALRRRSPQLGAKGGNEPGHGRPAELVVVDLHRGERRREIGTELLIAVSSASSASLYGRTISRYRTARSAARSSRISVQAPRPAPETGP
jgi:hypothetical protein